MWTVEKETRFDFDFFLLFLGNIEEIKYKENDKLTVILPEFEIY